MKLEDYLNENKCNLHTYDNGTVDVESYTPAGGDMVISLDELSKEKLQEYIDNFDINEEVLMWWQNEESRERQPFQNVRDMYNDYEKWLDNLQRIVDGIDDIEEEEEEDEE